MSVQIADPESGSTQLDRRQPDNSNGIYLIFILFVAFLLRVYMCFFSGLTNYNSDTISYFQMADGILSGAPISYFPNGYPLIVAGVRLIVEQNFVNSALLALNVLLSTAVVAMAYYISKRISGSVSALIVAALVAVWPNQLNYTRQLLSEAPCVFFLTAAIALLLFEHRLLSGIAFSAASLVRSSLLPVGPLELCVIFIRRPNRQALFLLIGLTTGPAFDYSLQAAGIIKPSSNFGSNLLIAITGNSTEGVDFSMSKFSQHEIEHPVITYLEFAAKRPIEFGQQRLSALWELWGPWPEPGDLKNPRGSVTRALIGLRFPLLLFALLALWNRRKNLDSVLMFVPILVITMTHFVFFSTPRFTFPIEPLLIVLAVAGIGDIYLRLRDIRREEREYKTIFGR